MLKIETGYIYLTLCGDIFKITNINKELFAMSIYNKCITVEFLYGTMADYRKQKDWGEAHVGYKFFEDHEAKCIGTNDKSAWILYGSNLKKEN